MSDYDRSDISNGHVSNEEDYSDSDSQPEVGLGGARDNDVAIEAIVAARDEDELVFQEFAECSDEEQEDAVEHDPEPNAEHSSAQRVKELEKLWEQTYKNLNASKAWSKNQNGRQQRHGSFQIRKIACRMYTRGAHGKDNSAEVRKKVFLQVMAE